MHTETDDGPTAEAFSLYAKDQIHIPVGPRCIRRGARKIAEEIYAN